MALCAANCEARTAGHPFMHIPAFFAGRRSSATKIDALSPVLEEGKALHWIMKAISCPRLQAVNGSRCRDQRLLDLLFSDRRSSRSDTADQCRCDSFGDFEQALYVWFRFEALRPNQKSIGVNNPSRNMQLVVILAYFSFKEDLSIKLASDRTKVKSLRDQWCY